MFYCYYYTFHFIPRMSCFFGELPGQKITDINQMLTMFKVAC